MYRINGVPGHISICLYCIFYDNTSEPLALPACFEAVRTKVGRPTSHAIPPRGGQRLGIGLMRLVDGLPQN